MAIMKRWKQKITFTIRSMGQMDVSSFTWTLPATNDLSGLQVPFSSMWQI